MGIVAASLVALAAPSAAQSPALSQGQIDLYSEMWALAGVCSQYRGYRVDGEGLADWLNQRLGALGEENSAMVSAHYNAKLAEIGDRVAEISELPRGNRRTREVERNAEVLMSRCYNLAHNDTAGEFFFIR